MGSKKDRCCVCNKTNAKIIYTVIDNDKLKEYKYCEGCFKKSGIDKMMGI